MIRQALAYNAISLTPIGPLKNALSPISLNATLNNKAELALKRNEENTLMTQMPLSRVEMQCHAPVQINSATPRTNRRGC